MFGYLSMFGLPNRMNLPGVLIYTVQLSGKIFPFATEITEITEKKVL
jgi:hypothetical protein